MSAPADDLEAFARQHDRRATAPLVGIVRTPGAETVRHILRHLVPALGAKIETRPFAGEPPLDGTFYVTLIGAGDLAAAPAFAPTTTVLALRNIADGCDIDATGLERLMANATPIVHAAPGDGSRYLPHMGSRWLRGSRRGYPGFWFLSGTILFEQEDMREIGALMDLKDSLWMIAPAHAAFALAAIDVVVRNPAAFSWYARWIEMGRQLSDSEYRRIERQAYLAAEATSLDPYGKLVHMQAEVARHPQAIARFKALAAERDLVYEKSRWLETIRRALAEVPPPADAP